jgi:haloacetate dehalogenase
MFEGFETHRVGGTNLVSGGRGEPVLLIHGYPQTHAMWHRVAPGLVAAGHTVVCPDLRGYGASHKPPADDDLANYSKRAMAAELVEVMAHLGHERFAVVGHDRGGRVAYRMALDHAETVSRLAVLDVIPTVDQWATLNGVAGVGSFHWHFLAQPHPFPEHVIEPAAEYWLRHLCSRWAADPAALEAAMPRYVAAFSAETIRGTCDDYRAGAFVDPKIDAADQDAGRRIACPVLVLWGDPSGRRPSPLDTWRRWADDVSGQPITCGHFLPEEAPAETLAALVPYLASPDVRV